MNPPAPPPLQPPPPPPPTAVTFLPAHHHNSLPPAPSLPVALSNLTSLLQLSATVLQSLPAPINTTPTTSSTFLPCPFNPNHRVPPSSLFSHYLNCPSPLSVPHAFQYPLTLHASPTATSAPSLPNTFSDLSISVENYIGYGAPANNFFYQNCPGPVTPSIQPLPSLNIPRDLYVECADFNKDCTREKAMSPSVDFIKFLPSEIWAIRSEFEVWGGSFPAVYSSRILRAILRLRDCKLLHLYDWIVASSPRYGVIIDFAMRDHVVLLLRLCLKVIAREAFGLLGVSDGELKTEGNDLVGLGNQTFECPVLVKVMMWLGLQFSVLYGEVNGKFFAVDMLKECILDSALHASLFPLELKNDELSDSKKVEDKVEEPVRSVVGTDDTKRDERENTKGETVGSSTVFISQVAAAVAALYERSLVEEKIKALRNSRPVPSYQRNMEHAYVSKRADEERQKRPDYRPIIDHDGFLWQRSTNQDTNKVKTREELLAEERDYKRRRMSYRGKKSKRNTLEVMRDIIEEYMEEITQAGGNGGMSKAVEEPEALASKSLNTHASAADVSGSRRNSDTLEENRSGSLGYRKKIRCRHDSENFEDDIQQQRRDSSWDHGHQDINRNVERIRYERNDYSGSWDGGKNSSDLREQRHGRENQDFIEAFGERSHQRRDESHERNYTKRNRDKREHNNYKRESLEHERTRRKREKYDDIGEHNDRRRRKTDSSHLERDEDRGRHGDRRRSKTNRTSSSHPETNEFEDRYDPAESHDRNDF